MKYGFLLTHDPFSAEYATVRELACAAVEKGIEAELFIMLDGGYAMSNPAIAELSDRGIKITYCHHNSEERHIAPPEGFVQGGIPELSGIMSECDRFFSF